MEFEVMEPATAEELDASQEAPVHVILGTHQLLATAIALGSLDPEEDESVWRSRRLAPMALHAQRHPTLEPALRWLARHWSSGALQGWTSWAWIAPDPRTGRSRAWTFADEWPRLLRTRFGPEVLDIDVIRQDAAEMEQRLHHPLPTLHFGESPFEAEAGIGSLCLLFH